MRDYLISYLEKDFKYENLSKIYNEIKYKPENSLITDLFREYRTNLYDDKIIREPRRGTRENDRSLESLLRELGRTSPTPSVSIPQPRVPTQEELQQMERQRRLDQVRSQLSSRFGTTVPYILSEEEIQRLSEPVVEPITGRWYLFLRNRGLQLSLPQSMDGQFSGMIDETVRQFITQTYGADTRLPLEVLWNMVQLRLAEKPTGYVIRAAENGQVSKNFPLGRVYRTVNITGLRERLDPVEATALLVYGLIGRKEKNVRAAYKTFSQEKLELARESLKHSHLSPKKIFGKIAPYLAPLFQGDVEAARRVLDYLSHSLPIEEVSDLVSGVNALFSEQEQFSHLLVKTQDGSYADMFDNSRLMACTFLPTGVYKEAALVYHSDPDVGLLHLVPRVIDRQLTPVGVSILVNAIDGNGDKWIIVDSVEGGGELDRVRDKLWIPAVYEGVLDVGRDTGAGYVMFNASVFNGRPKRFLEYVAKRHSTAQVPLQKAGLQDFSHLGISSHHLREAFEAWKCAGAMNGNVNGYVAEVRR